MESKLKRAAGAAMVAMALGLAGCGGGKSSDGSSSGSATTTAVPAPGQGGGNIGFSGIFSEETADRTLQTYLTVLPDGEYWGFTSNPAGPYGLLHGVAAGSPASVSGSAEFYNFVAYNGGKLITGGTMTASYADPVLALGVTIPQSSGAAALSVSLSAAGPVPYGAAPTLAALAGTYQGTGYSVGLGLSNEPFGDIQPGTQPLTLGADGSVSLTLGNCALAATLTPMAGQAAFALSGTISGCSISGPVAGVATPLGFLPAEAATGSSRAVAAQENLTFEMLSADGTKALVLNTYLQTSASAQ